MLVIEATPSVLVVATELHSGQCFNYVIELLLSFFMQKNTYCSGCNVDLREFGRKCQRAVLHSLIDENVSNSGFIHWCTWLQHLITVQNLQAKRSQLAAGPFQGC